MGYINNNIFPYILIILMGIMSWYLYFELKETKAQAEADSEAYYQTVSIVNDFTNERIAKLESIRKEEWTNGKNTGSY